MKYTTILWDLDDDPDGNVQHVVEHGISKAEVEEVLDNPADVEHSRSSDRPIAFGETSDGRLIAVVFEEIDDQTARPVTAYEIDE